MFRGSCNQIIITNFSTPPLPHSPTFLLVTPYLLLITCNVGIRLNTQPRKAFGFKLRQDSNALVHQGMLDVLRDAFFRNTNVTIDYDIESGKKNGRIIRVWVSK